MKKLRFEGSMDVERLSAVIARALPECEIIEVGRAHGRALFIKRDHDVAARVMVRRKKRTILVAGNFARSIDGLLPWKYVSLRKPMAAFEAEVAAAIEAAIGEGT